MDARKPAGKLDPAQLRALLRADIQTAKASSQTVRAAGVIEASAVDSHVFDADPTSTVIVSRAYQDQVAESNLRIQRSVQSKTSPILKVRRGANS